MTSNHEALQEAQYEFQKENWSLRGELLQPIQNENQDQNQENPENNEDQDQNFAHFRPPSAPRSQSEKKPGGQVPIPDQNHPVHHRHHEQ